MGWLEGLHTPRYWDIQRTSLGTEQPLREIFREVDHQIQRIDRLVGRLRPIIEQERRGDQTAVRAVLDTNAHLHYKPFDHIHWPTVLGARSVRVVVPLHVIREFDEKKNNSREALSNRAGRRLKLLRSLLAAGGRGPVPVPGRPGVTVEVPFGFDHLLRHDTDGAIVETALALSQRPGAKVRLLTGDLSMQLRASAVGLDVAEMSAEHRQPLQIAADSASVQPDPDGMTGASNGG